MPFCLLLLVGCQQDEPRKISNPTIEWDRTPVVKVGDSVNFEVRQGNGSSGSVHHNWEVAPSALPPGVAIQYDNAKFLLTGSPTTVGTYTIPIKVTIGDVDKKSTSRDLTFIVPSTTGPLTIYTPDLPGGNETTGTYSTEIVATGGTNTGYSWSVVGGVAPTGLAVGAWPTGGMLYISGIGVKEGTYNFTLQVTDDGGNTDTQDLQLVITPPILAHAHGYTVGPGSGP